ADEKIAPAAPVVPESSEKELPQRVGEYAEGGHRADANNRLVMAEPALRQFLHQQRRGDREIRPAVVAGGIAREQQQDGSELPVAQRSARAQARLRQERSGERRRRSDLLSTSLNTMA